MKPKLKEALDNLTKKDIIYIVDRPHNVCTTQKNGELRFVLDPEHFNKALKREHYHLTVLHEILPNMLYCSQHSISEMVTDTSR